MTCPPTHQIRVFSDLHLDMDLVKNKTQHVFFPEPLPGDEHRVLVLAGDIWHYAKWIKFGSPQFSWIQHLAPRFRHVVIVMGNHDWWRTRLDVKKARDCSQLLLSMGVHNVSLLEQSSWTDPLTHWTFVGATLFTNLGKNLGWADSSCRAAALLGSQASMGAPPLDSNYRWIASPRHTKLSGLDVARYHQQTLDTLRTILPQHNPAKTVLVTHYPAYYAPHLFQGLPLPHPSSELSAGLDANHCPDLFQQASIVINGHDHQALSTQHQIPGLPWTTRFFVNPRGYPGESTGFDPRLVVDLLPQA